MPKFQKLVPPLKYVIRLPNPMRWPLTRSNLSDSLPCNVRNRNFAEPLSPCGILILPIIAGPNQDVVLFLKGKLKTKKIFEYL